MPSPRKSLTPRSASKPEPQFDTAWATAGEIAAAVAEGRVSAVTVAEDALARITERDPVLNSFTDVLAERALARAAAVDAGKLQGTARGRAVRGEEPVRRERPADASPARRSIASFPPPQHDSAADRAARSGRRRAGRRAQHGRIRLRLHRRERARRQRAQSARRDAHDRRLVERLGRRGRGRAGAALARLRHQRLDPRAVLVLRAVRAEADLRPAVPRARSFPFVSSFDHLGPLARSARDLALAYDAMQGPDAEDPVCTDRPLEPTLRRARARHQGPAHRGRGRLFQEGHVPGGLRRGRARRLGARRQYRYRDPGSRSARAPPPTSSRRAKARACISTGCARARTITIRRCATA